MHHKEALAMLWLYSWTIRRQHHNVKRAWTSKETPFRFWISSTPSSPAVFVKVLSFSKMLISSICEAESNDYTVGYGVKFGNCLVNTIQSSPTEPILHICQPGMFFKSHKWSHTVLVIKYTLINEISEALHALNNVYFSRFCQSLLFPILCNSGIFS